MDKRMFVLFLIFFVNVLGIGLILPLLPYFATNLGATPIVVGLFVAAYPFFSILSGPPLGVLSDRYGRRPILLISLAGTVIGYFILGIAATLPLLFLSRIIDGATAGNSSTVQAAMADISKKSKRTESIGLLFVADSLGLIGGPLIGGFFTQYGYSIPAFIAGAIAIVGFLLTALFLPETRNFSQKTEKRKAMLDIGSLFKVVHQVRTRTLVLVIFLAQLLIMMMWGTLALYGKALFAFSGQTIGYISSFAALAGITAQVILLKSLLKIAKEEKLLALALFSMSVGFFILGAAPTIVVVLLGVGVMAASWNIATPVATGIVSRLSSRYEQGYVMGTVSSVINIASVVGPIFATAIYSISIRGTYFISAIVAFLALLLIVGLLKRRKK